MNEYRLNIHFNNLDNNDKLDVLKNMVYSGGCIFYRCTDCPINYNQNEAWCSPEYVRKRASEEIINLFGSHYLFDILIDLPHNI